MSNRRHDTQSEREHWLAHFEKQRSTATSFCRDHGLCYQTFLRWRQNTRKTISSNAAPAPFIELDLPARPSTPTCGELVELTFPGGLTLRIQAQTTPQP